MTCSNEGLAPDSGPQSGQESGGSARTLAVHALTPRGARLARGLAQELGADLYLPEKLAGPGERSFTSLPELTAGIFHAYAGHVFVAACGIVVRCVAPHLKGKATDPGVVVLDQEGRHAVSLLSGHLGGANDLARRVAAVTGGQAVITTATDTAGLPSLDLLARDSGLAIENISAVKTVNGALLAGKTIQVFDPETYLAVPPTYCQSFEWVAGPHLLEPGRAGVAVTWRTGRDGRDSAFGPDVLVLRPRVVVAGVGCRKGVPAGDIVDAISSACADRGVAVKSLSALASIEAKRHEPGLVEAARILGADLVFFPPERLMTVTVPNPSKHPLKHMGVESVCEAAALLAAGTDRLLLAKTKTPAVTVALALAG